jgi:hypothetical protein
VISLSEPFWARSLARAEQGDWQLSPLGGEAGLASLAILNVVAGNLARQIDQR